MAEVLITSLEQLGPVTYRAQWDNSGGGTFYVWADGALLGTTEEGYWDFQVGVGRVVSVAVFDDAADAPGEWYPATLTLRWEGRPGDVIYRVEQWTGAAWAAVAQVVADARQVYHYETNVLDDATAYQWRVVPVDAASRDGSARTFSGTMCRYPEAPAVTVVWDSGEITIDEA